MGDGNRFARFTPGIWVRSPVSTRGGVILLRTLAVVAADSTGPLVPKHLRAHGARRSRLVITHIRSNADSWSQSD
jgi:hypothetical protein